MSEGRREGGREEEFTESHQEISDVFVFPSETNQCYLSVGVHVRVCVCVW